MESHRKDGGGARRRLLVDRLLALAGPIVEPCARLGYRGRCHGEEQVHLVLGQRELLHGIVERTHANGERFADTTRCRSSVSGPGARRRSTA